jgi:4-diphosphocytidyl-2-C-methyl-D-erythritol kinase
MQNIRLFAPAKVNLSLNILGKSRGYHLLDSIMLTVSCGDTVSISKRTDNKISVHFASSYPLPDNNSASKAAKIMQDTFGMFGCDIKIEKNIPLAGGMGGSSADAAAVIVGINKLFGFSNDTAVLQKVAMQVGSDVPFLLCGGSVRVGETGEKLIPFSCGTTLHMLILHTAQCETKAVYDEFDRQGEEKKVLSDNDKIVSALQSGTLPFPLFSNALTASADFLCGGKTKKAIAAFQEAAAKAAVMTGSGGCTVGYFDSENAAKQGAEILKSKGYNPFYVHSSPLGVREI